MPNIAPSQQVAYRVDVRTVETFNVLGPAIELLTLPGEDENAPCVMRGVIPPGGFVPLHSHPDPETFVSISGGFEGLVRSPGDFEWLRIMPGEVFHIPSEAKHAFRNQSSVPAVAIVISTQKMGRFFRRGGHASQSGIKYFNRCHSALSGNCGTLRLLERHSGTESPDRQIIFVCLGCFDMRTVRQEAEPRRRGDTEERFCASRAP